MKDRKDPEKQKRIHLQVAQMGMHASLFSYQELCNPCSDLLYFFSVNARQEVRKCPPLNVHIFLHGLGAIFSSSAESCMHADANYVQSTKYEV